jgi:hypothetical protein
MTRLTRSAAVLVVALVTAAALSGCSDQRLGSAAVVDGDSIPTSDLQAASRAYLKLVPEAESAEVQRSILQRIILSEVIDKAAREKGVGVSAGKVASERDDLLGSVGGRKGLIRALATQQQATVLAPQYVDRWFKDQLLFRRIARQVAGPGGDPRSTEVSNATSALLSKTASGMDIEVSPRYGTWSTQKGVTALLSGGLAQPPSELNG